MFYDGDITGLGLPALLAAGLVAAGVANLVVKYRPWKADRPNAQKADRPNAQDDPQGEGREPVIGSAMAVLEVMHDPALVVDRDGTIRYANALAGAFLHPKDSLTGQSVSAVLTGIDWKSEISALRECQDIGRIHSVTADRPILAKTGNEEAVPIDVTLRATNAFGAPAVVACLRRVADTRTQPDIPRLSERALAASTDGIVIVDAQQNDQPIIYANAAFYELTGYGPEDVIGQNCRFLQGDDQNQSAIAILRRAIQEGRHCRVRLRNYRKNRSCFINELSVSPVHDDAGVLTHFIGTQHDASVCENQMRQIRTARHRAEAALALLDDALESVAAGVMILDVDDRVVNVNQAMLHQLRHFTTINVGDSFCDIVDEGVGSMIADGICSQEIADSWRSKRLAAHRDRPSRTELLRPDGEVIRYTEYGTSSGGTVIIHEKITGEWKAREALANAKDQAELANRAKSAFLAHMSHELRTPLNAIIGFSEIMTNRLFGDMGNEKYQPYAHDILDSAKELLGMIDDLLDLSLIEAESVPVSPTTFTLAPFLSDIRETFGERREQIRVSVEIEHPHAPSLTVVSDRRLLSKLVSQLIANALVIGTSSHVVSVTCRRFTDSTLMIRVESSLGERQQSHTLDLARLPEPNRGAYVKSPDGAGLGTAILEGYSHALGGTLSVSSERGMTSTATLELPLLDARTNPFPLTGVRVPETPPAPEKVHSAS